jgi:hypothetical protein
MADKKKKSIYDYKLKDVNKDDRTNFGDTWLGDALGFDGKMGTQGPGLKDSMKGARRNMGPSKSKRPKARSESTSSAPTKSKRPKSRDSEPLQRGPSKRRGPRNKPELSSRLDTKGQTPKSPDKKTTTAKERVSKASVTDYRDDAKARRKNVSGSLPSGYNRVSIPGMAKGGMACDKSKKDHRKSGMFTKTGSPKGFK